MQWINFRKFNNLNFLTRWYFFKLKKLSPKYFFYLNRLKDPNFKYHRILGYLAFSFIFGIDKTVLWILNLSFFDKNTFLILHKYFLVNFLSWNWNNLIDFSLSKCWQIEKKKFESWHMAISPFSCVGIQQQYPHCTLETHRTRLQLLSKRRN